MTLEGTSSVEFLASGEPPLLIRSASERKDAKPLISEDVVDAALNLSMSMSDSRPCSASLTLVGIIGAVVESFPSAGWLYRILLNESKCIGLPEPYPDQSFELTKVSGAKSNGIRDDRVGIGCLLFFVAASDRRCA
jgi:hypothetical protein